MTVRKKDTVSSQTTNMSSSRGVIAVLGATGVGKTRLAVEIARAVGGEIVNCDSMQVIEARRGTSRRETVNACASLTQHEHYTFVH